MDDDWSTPIVVLRLLQHSNEIDDCRSVGRALVLQPISVLVLLDGSALVDLCVGDGELSHRVRSKLCHLCQLNEHVTVLVDLLVGPVTNALLL